MAKPSKKAKMNKPAEDTNPSKPEKQIPEASHPTTEITADDPPPEEHNIAVEPMDAEPATTKPPSPAQEKAEDVIITGLGYTEPGNPTVLSKHSAKEEIPAADKGKWKLDVENYAQYSAQEIHSGYLSRLYSSRDFEAGLVNLMKERFEVNIIIFSIYISVSRQVYWIW